MTLAGPFLVLVGFFPSLGRSLPLGEAPRGL